MTRTWTAGASAHVAWLGLLAAALVLDPAVRGVWWLPVLASTVFAVVAGLAPLAARVADTATGSEPADGTHRAALAQRDEAAVTVHRVGVPVAVVISAVSLAKRGSSDAENEDGWAARGATIAVSDGASSSFRSGEWARALCSDFVERRPDWQTASIGSFLAGAAQRFRASDPAAPAAALEDETDQQSASDDWLASATASRASHATFAALGLDRVDGRLAWRAAAVGDSVVIQVSAGHDGPRRVVVGFPIDHSAGFSGDPHLLSSAMTDRSDLPAIRTAEGYAEQDDRFLVVTDEAARWALSRHEAGRPIWDLLLSGTEQQIRTSADEARDDDEIVNDDMTIVRVGLDHGTER